MASVLITCSTATVASSARYGRTYRRSSAQSIPLLSHIRPGGARSAMHLRIAKRAGQSACRWLTPRAAATVHGVTRSTSHDGRCLAVAAPRPASRVSRRVLAIRSRVARTCPSGAATCRRTSRTGRSSRSAVASATRRSPSRPRCRDWSTPRRTRSGCQWLAGGSILGPHFSFTWFRGSPIGRERKTEELSRTSVEDINIEGHDGFIAAGDDPTLGNNLCEIGIQFDDDFIEWSISFAQKPFPDPCDVAKELTRQSIVNSK